MYNMIVVKDLTNANLEALTILTSKMSKFLHNELELHPELEVEITAISNTLSILQKMKKAVEEQSLKSKAKSLLEEATKYTDIDYEEAIEEAIEEVKESKENWD